MDRDRRYDLESLPDSRSEIGSSLHVEIISNGLSDHTKKIPYKIIYTVSKGPKDEFGRQKLSVQLPGKSGKNSLISRP